MKWATELFGSTLHEQPVTGGAHKNVATSEALMGSKYVLVYLSAHFCPPCRKLTPVLAAMYEDLQAHCEDHAKPLEVSVVFVSADHSDDEFYEYYAQMPWHALPYEAPERHSILEAYGNEGIPRVLLFDSATGQVVDPSARQRIIKAKSLIGLEVQ